MGVPKVSTEIRRESRIPMEVGVHISGHAKLPEGEATFTENVSSRGARVLSTRRWKTGDQLTIRTMAGSFRTTARVTYCQAVPGVGFALGLEFREPLEHWFVGGGSLL